jgi:hypothetical protein
VNARLEEMRLLLGKNRECSEIWVLSAQSPDFSALELPLILDEIVDRL